MVNCGYVLFEDGNSRECSLLFEPVSDEVCSDCPKNMKGESTHVQKRREVDSDSDYEEDFEITDIGIF